MSQLSVQHAFELAIQHHQAGRLRDAEQLYRQVIARQPAHADAIHYLGVLAHQGQRSDVAVDLIRRAISLRPAYAEAYANLGLALKAQGRAHDAIAAYRQAIALRPRFAEALGNLAAALVEQRQFDQAISTCRAAIAVNPGAALTHLHLGVALKSTGDLDGAIASFRRAIELQPQRAETYSLLGAALGMKGNLPEAIAAFRQAIARRPDLAEAHANLGAALRGPGQLEEAMACCRRAIALRPDFPEAHSNLGVALKDSGHLDQAIASFRHAVALRPAFPDAWCNLGMALKDKGLLDEAIAACRQAIAQNPLMAEAHNNLGVALNAAGQVDEAMAECKKAIALDPGLAAGYTNLGTAQKDAGLIDEAIATWRLSLARRPDHAEAHSNLIYALHLHPDSTRQTISHECRRFDQIHGERFGAIARPALDIAPGRRLRIGYVSPDFRNHVVGRNMLPLFRHHDHGQFEIFCYASMPGVDEMTGEFRSRADGWRNIVGLSDNQAADMIRNDRIDILVDLAVHTANNRLLIFARKPAPIQSTFAGYPGGTGLAAIDYRLSDAYLDPPDMDESVYREKTIRLPHSFWCYDPLDMSDVDVSESPAAINGFITYGCLNNFSKINGPTIALWAKAMAKTPNSRLLLLAPPGSHRERTIDQFQGAGVAAARIEFAGSRPRRQYLQLFHRIDLSLDTFPYNGHTTGLDSLWMGVPMVTLVGKTAVSRAGWCHLSNLGLPELAAHSPEQFVDIVAALAGDFARLAELRSTLRRRMEQSPLMDARGFAAGIEQAYRKMLG